MTINIWSSSHALPCMFHWSPPSLNSLQSSSAGLLFINLRTLGARSFSYAIPKLYSRTSAHSLTEFKSALMTFLSCSVLFWLVHFIILVSVLFYVMACSSQFMGKWYEVAVVSTCPHYMQRKRGNPVIVALELKHVASEENFTMTATTFRSDSPTCCFSCSGWVCYTQYNLSCVCVCI